MINTLMVHAMRDEDAGVWVATSDDIPGLVTESETYDGLVQRILAVAPELLRDNAHLVAGPLVAPIKIEIATSHVLAPVAA